MKHLQSVFLIALVLAPVSSKMGQEDAESDLSRQNQGSMYANVLRQHNYYLRFYPLTGNLLFTLVSSGPVILFTWPA